MKRKKIFLFIFAFFTIILPIINVKADLTCVYKYDNNPVRYFKIVYEGNNEYPYSGVLYQFSEYYKIKNQVITEYSELQGKSPKIFFEDECPKRVMTNLGYAVETYYVIKEEVFKSTPHEDGGSLWYVGVLVESYDEGNANKVYCGREEEGRITAIPKKIPELTSTAVTIIQIAIPIILVVLGSIDLFKGITAGKEDEIKKGQQMFIKRLVIAAVIFFVVIIVKFLISIIDDTNDTNIGDCIDCFINNDCKEM